VAAPVALSIMGLRDVEELFETSSKWLVRRRHFDERRSGRLEMLRAFFTRTKRNNLAKAKGGCAHTSCDSHRQAACCGPPMCALARSAALVASNCNESFKELLVVHLICICFVYGTTFAFLPTPIEGSHEAGDCTPRTLSHERYRYPEKSERGRNTCCTVPKTDNSNIIILINMLKYYAAGTPVALSRRQII
jgi:hypothetical protein